MITLDDYKKRLIKVYKYPIDNTESKREERLKYLEKQYSDVALNKIIIDSYEFAKLVLKEDTTYSGYCEFPFENYDDVNYIGLGLVGGYHADVLYYYNDLIISEIVLEEIFGKNLIIEIKEEQIDFETDDPDIISFDYYYYIYLQGFPNNLEEIKENLLGHSKKIK